MATRVEGRVALKVHGTDDAGMAAMALAVALVDYAETYEPDLTFEVVGVDLVQVVEDDAVSD